jgi:hypothetical protein
MPYFRTTRRLESQDRRVTSDPLVQRTEPVDDMENIKAFETDWVTLVLPAIGGSSIL